jgi:hypothetical protein
MHPQYNWSTDIFIIIHLPNHHNPFPGNSWSINWWMGAMIVACITWFKENGAVHMQAWLVEKGMK